MTEQFAEYDRRIFWGLASVFLLVLMLYVYFLSVSVFAVISRKDAEQQSMALGAQISQLESRYVTLESSVDLALAHERGFLDIAVPRYISKEKTKTVITMRTAQ